jgi:para-aminobenzoate synthetase component 1
LGYQPFVNLKSVIKLTVTNNTITLSIAPLKIESRLAPLDVFAPLANIPWAMWLDSCSSDHIDSQFDIMVWQPAITLTTKDQTTTIHNLNNETVELSDDDPLFLINKIQTKLFSPSLISAFDIPFKGGAVGYFSYDLGRHFETLPAKAKQDIGIADMAIGIYTQAIVFNRHSKQYYLVCPDDKRTSIEQAFAQQLNEHLSKKNQNQLAFKLSSAWQANISKKEYAQKFARVHRYLLSGDCYQINLSQRFTATYQGDEFSAYTALREKNKAPFSAFIRLENCAILSISPERFLQLKQGKVQSKPIKGTRPRSPNASIDAANASELLNSEKDKAENLMIVDLLRNDISKVCLPGSVNVPKLFDIESFPAVHHLVSTVEGELAPEYNATDLLRGAFPGGSITGAPKIRAMEIIEELEPQRRSVYCGSIGYISACGNMDSSITIRTLICQNNNIYCSAGGGLVADSNVDNEYQETFDKVHKILPVLSAL